MANNGTTHNSPNGNVQMYVLAVICFVVGIAIGYFFRGSEKASTPQAAAASQQAPAGMGGGANPGQVTREQLKHMVEKQVEPLLAKLQSAPKDPSILSDIGNVYYDAQLYEEAIGYYDRVLEVAPKNLSVRTDRGTAYWYLGDADHALAEFDSVLKEDPKMANTLFNRGMVRWQGKMDVTGAVADWQKLLDTNPNYENREKVTQLIAKAKEHSTMKPGTKTDKAPTIR